MRKNIVVVKLAILFFAISATAVVMPGADTRNAYKFKKDYENAFKDKQAKIAALKFKKNMKSGETDNTGNYIADDELADNRHRDERQNADTLLALNSRNPPPTNTTTSTGDSSNSETGTGPGDNNPPGCNNPGASGDNSNNAGDAP